MIMSIAGTLHAECNCLQPFYKDKIDLLTRYTACLEQCYNSKIEALENRVNQSESRIGVLEAEIERLNETIKQLEGRISNN